MPEVRLESKILAGADIFGDSIRLFLRPQAYLSGNNGPFYPQFVRVPEFIVTLNKFTGSMGQVHSLPKDLITLSHNKQCDNYNLLLMASNATTLRYEVGDSSWRLTSQSNFDLNALLPFHKMETPPQVLAKQKGIGFVARSTRAGNDTLHYVRLNSQGQLIQQERIDSLPRMRSTIEICGAQRKATLLLFCISKNCTSSKPSPVTASASPHGKFYLKNRQVSPMLANDQLQLKIKPTQHQNRYPYQIHGLTGQLYQRGQLRFQGSEATLDISGLAPGAYILLLGEGKERYRAKFTVE